MNSSKNIDFESLENLFRLNENRRSKLIAQMDSDISEFNYLLKYALANEKYSWRATNVIKNHIQQNDERIIKHLDAIIVSIENKEDGHQRELLGILLKCDIAEEFEGRLFDICCTIWEDIQKIPSTRSLAFQQMNKIALKYPELKNEMKLFCEEYYTESLSPGIKKGIMKLIKG